MDFFRKLTKPTFQITGYGQGIVQFACSKSLSPVVPVDGIAVMPDGAKVDLTVNIQDGHSGHYAASVVGPAETLALLEQTFLPHARDQKQQMFYKPDEDSMTRHARTYAMRCRDFPNFKGVTAELSGEGALVMLSGPVEAGLKTQVTIDLDDTDIDPFSIDAEVVWCKQREEKVWVADIAFPSVSPEVDELMREFLEKLKNRTPGSRGAL